MKIQKIFLIIGKNTLIQIIGKIINVFISLITVALLTRYLGVGGYGNYTLIFAYAGFFSSLTDFGLSVVFIREISESTFEKQLLQSTFFWLKFIFVVSTILLGICFIPFLPYISIVKIGIMLGLLAVSIGSFQGFSTTLLQAKVRLDIVTIIDIVTKLATIFLIILFIFFHANFLIIILSVLLGNSVGLFVSFFFVKETIKFPLLFNPSIAKKIFILSIPIGFSSLIALLYFKVDTFLLSLFKSSTQVGIYSIAYKMLENLLLLWGFYMASVFPLLTKLKSADNKKFNYLFQSTFRIAIASSIFLTIISYLLAPVIVYILGGVRFNASIPSFRILIFALPFLFLNNTFFYYFLIKNRFKIFVWSICIACIINVVVNLLTIPLYGYIAASITTVVTEVVLFACLFIMFIIISKKENMS